MPPADDNALTARQDYYAEHQVLPSYTTIADLLGLKSKAWISALVSRLILQRFLAFTADKRLKPGRGSLNTLYLTASKPVCRIRLTITALS